MLRFVCEIDTAGGIDVDSASCCWNGISKRGEGFNTGPWFKGGTVNESDGGGVIGHW